MHRIFIIFWMGLLLLSCDSGNKDTRNKETEGAATTVYFEKLDSIRIDYLGNPSVHDLDPKSGTILFMEHRQFSEDIMVANFEGHIVTSFSKLSDRPDSYGGLMSTLRILDDKTFLVYGYNGFMTYDFTGELQSQVKLKDFRVPNFTWKAMGFGMEKWNGKYLYVDQGSRHIDYSSIDAYNEMRLLNWLDPKTGEKEPFIQFPESSIFRSGKYFFRDSWAPSFTLADDRIYVVFGAEPVIYVFSLNKPYSLLSSVPVDLKDYRYFSGSNDNSIDGTLRFTSGNILNIKKIAGYFVIAYFPGYSDADKEAENENKTQQENLLFRERMLKKYAKRIAILDAEGHKVSDFVPDGLTPESMLLRNNELWMQEKPDEEVERDYFRLFRVELRVENKNGMD
ncbi:hypothetical protein [Cyclobacterium roseum]|uniref:hypothetical protein n=1 Tax=Cyclobacterium roseum TaxID=2666137 RepID=UPI001F33D599|nr:hypothetical protein [Cyclobacterium roseum]